MVSSLVDVMPAHRLGAMSFASSGTHDTLEYSAPGAHAKAPRMAPRRLMMIVRPFGSADLLDRRQLPVGAG
ncbi:MAG: hypothetical protein E6848_30775, partial [Bradyrhizobium sp.]|nr:hypothetical protein [Bradyrhizobium sp.]